MRITANMVYSSVLSNLTSNSRELDKLNWQASSLQKVRFASDGPIETVKQMNLKTQETKLEQYLSNIVDSNQWLTSQDKVLNEVTELLHKARTITIQAANDTLTEEDRFLIAQEVDQVLENLVNAANTTVGGSYLYGGTENLSAPFNENPFSITRGSSGTMTNVITNVEYKGDFQPIYREIEEGIAMQINNPGSSVFMATPYTVEMPDLNISDPSQGLKLDNLIPKIDTGYFAINEKNIFYNVSGKYQADSLLDLRSKINSLDLNAKATVEGSYIGEDVGLTGDTDGFSGTFFINDTQINVVNTDSVTKIVEKINNVSNSTGVSASLEDGAIRLDGGFELSYPNSFGNILNNLGLVSNDTITGKYTYEPDEKTQIEAGKLFINGAEIDVQEKATMNQVATAINAETGTTGVSANIVDNRIVLSATAGITSISQDGTNAMNVLGILDSNNRIRTDMHQNGTVTDNYSLKLASNDNHQFFLDDRGSGNFLKEMGFIVDNVDDKPVTSPNNISNDATVTNHSIFNVLIKIRDDMINDNVRELNGTNLDLVDSSIQNLLQQRAQVGAKINRLEALDERLNAFSMNNKELLSQVSEVDISEIIMKLTALENTQKAALSVGSRLFSLSLMDFLR
jgi:flagellar hook-associated protein 3